MTTTAAPEQEQEQPSTQAEAPVAESQQLVRASAAASIGFGLSARNWDEGLRIARTLANSALVPKAYQGRPEDVVVAMQYGAEIGLPPMAALQSVAVINGKPGVYGDGFLGVIMSKPAYLKHLEYYQLSDGTQLKSLRAKDYEDDDTKAVSIFWRKGNPEPFVGEFSIADAKRAKLWGKEGPWTTYPARQMKWRARGFAGRDGFAAELRGVKMAEELLDTPEDEITVETVHMPVSEPVRRSEKSAGTGTTTAAAADDPVLQSELPPENTPPRPTPATAPASQDGGRGGGAKKTAATQPPAATPVKKSQFKTSTPSVQTPNMLITDTQVVEPKGVDRFYEVHATRKEPGKADVGFVLLTDDEALFKIADTCTGSETLFVISWAGGKKYDGSNCKVLLGIAAAN